jgi:RNA polymerase sigma factor (sigma-70 family)
MLPTFMAEMTEPASAVSHTPSARLEGGFEAFFEAEHARLLRALFIVTGSRQEAEELMQDAFVSVWERWDRVSAMEDPTGYLYRTAMNRFRSRLRAAVRASRRAVVPQPPADPLEAVDDRDRVLRALAALTVRQRAALVLTEFLGFSSDDAATMLGVKPVTVRVLASQARAEIRRRAGGDDE